jgi:hypothetical protein
MAAKRETTSLGKTKVKSSTPRAVQQGNENQRENYRATGKPKISAQAAKKSGRGEVNQERRNQRAGGPLNRSYDEKLASKSKLANLASKRNSKDTASRATPVVKVMQQRKAKKK